MTKTIKLPKFDIAESVEDTLVNMYRALGWNGKTELNPRDVLVNKKTWLELCDIFIEIDSQRGGLIYMNYSPSKDDTVADGKVKIRKSFLKGE